MQARISAAATLLAGLAIGAAQAAPPVQDTLAQRAKACTLCHGQQGRAAADGYYPRLAGKPQGYLHEQLLAFRDGRRQYGPMSQLIAPLSDAYLHELAGYFASLDLPYASPQPASLPPAELARAQALLFKGDASRGLPACAACHGEKLAGARPFIPGLLGLPRDYLNGQLGAWRSGQRRAAEPDCMARIAHTLQPAEINAISHWLAAQTVPAGYKPAAALPAELPLKCGGLR
jgi:cytochrome c553